MLCQECKAVFQRPVTLSPHFSLWSARFEYDITLDGLRQKARECFGCRGLEQLVAAHNSNASGMVDTTPLRMMYDLSGPTSKLKGSDVRWWKAVVLEGKRLGSQTLFLEQSLTRGGAEWDSTNTGSAETLGFARGCLDRCRTSHKRCAAMVPAIPWHPTRLIEVQNDSVRLVEPSETGISEPYASLSHCWGGAEILRLTNDTLASFKTEVPFSELPQTFQNAILVVRSLGIRYIWIDSLCIIQDSKEDWHKEARTMLKVYMHAICNIAASYSSNSFQGLFRNRNLASLASNEPLDVDNGTLKGRFNIINEEYFSQEIDDAPLNQRCWVAQERVLSGRIIHFASEQVIWDCAELTACESLPYGTRIWPDSKRMGDKIGCKQGSHFLQTPKSVDHGLGQWARIVHTYSACGLTVPGDKIMAISGMAEHLRNEMKLEYCAGLWRPKMEIQLAWHVTQLQPGKSPRNDLAPSWSWVSVNGTVDLQRIDLYEGYDITPLASVTEVKLRTEANEDRGERITGSLRMRCSLNPVRLEGSAQSYRLEGNGMEHAVRAFIDSAEFIGAERLFLIPLFDIPTPFNVAEDKWKVSSEIRGILVQGVEGSPGTYMRCGHAFLASKTKEDTRTFDQAYEAIKSAEGKAELPCEEYGPACGHLITLI